MFKMGNFILWYLKMLTFWTDIQISGASEQKGEGLKRETFFIVN